MKQYESFSCNKCGNVVEVHNVGGGTLLCCGEDMHSRISWLFIVTNESAILKSKGNYDDKTVGNHFIIDIKSNITAFSDRPNRQAKKVAGGLNAFSKFYEKSNFMKNPPNVTFAGLYTETDKENSTVFEMEMPFVYQNKFIIPIKNVIGDQVLPPYGSYVDVNFVIDSAWFGSSLIHGATHIINQGVKTGTGIVNGGVKTGTGIVDGGIKIGTTVINQVGEFVSSTYEDAVSDVEKGVKEVEHIAQKIEDEAKQEVYNVLRSIANSAEGDYRDTMKGLNDALQELDVKSISQAFTERNMEKLAEAYVHLLVRRAEDLINIIDGKTDTFLIFEDIVQGALGFGVTGAISFGLNLTKIREQLKSVIYGNFDEKTLKQQIVDGTILEFFIAGGATVGIEAGGTVGVCVGLSFGSTLDAQTIDIGVNATSVEGVDTTVSFSIPSNIFDVGGYSLAGITASADIGAEFKVAIGGTYTKSICIDDFIASKKKTVCYFFKNSEYARVNLDTEKTDNGYPMKISSGWSSLPWSENIDATVNWGNGKSYLFKGDEYVRYDNNADKIDNGYPMKISSGWSSLPWFDNIDAIVNWGNGKVYFFRGSEYIRYDIKKDTIDDNYPRSIEGNWSKLPWSDGIDSIINWGNGKVYFFKDSEYIRYDIQKDQMDDGYPLSIDENWDNLPWSSEIGGLMSW